MLWLSRFILSKWHACVARNFSAAVTPEKCRRWGWPWNNSKSFVIATKTAKITRIELPSHKDSHKTLMRWMRELDRNDNPSRTPAPPTPVPGLERPHLQKRNSSVLQTMVNGKSFLPETLQKNANAPILPAHQLRVDKQNSVAYRDQGRAPALPRANLHRLNVSP